MRAITADYVFCMDVFVDVVVSVETLGVLTNVVIREERAITGVPFVC